MNHERTRIRGKAYLSETADLSDVTFAAIPKFAIRYLLFAPAVMRFASRLLLPPAIDLLELLNLFRR
jgi:hypothetical protein